jgi:hypothetical protein
MTRFASGIAAAALCAGCAVPFAPAATTWDSLAPAALRAQSGASVRVALAMDQTKYRAQALVTGYQRVDVAHVVVSLYAVAAQETLITTTDVASADFDRILTIGNLKQNTTYRVRGVAYKAAGTLAQNKVSTDASSFTDVTVTNNDRPSAARLPISLLGATFSAQATASLTITAGNLVHNGSEGIAVVP